MWIVAALAAALAAEAEVEPAKLDVTGVGEVYVAPDEAVLTLGVRAQADTADQAFDDAAAIMQDVVAAVGQGVSKERIRTSRLSLEPRYEYTENAAPRLVGYEAGALLEIRVDDPNEVGAVLDAAVAAGANEVAGIAWIVEDEDAARQEALDAAVADARTNAAQVASDLGIALGAPLRVEIRAQQSSPPVMYERAYAEDSDMGAGMPVLGGEQIYYAEVDVSFAIEELEAEPGS